MADLVINLLSGLVGALIGAFAGILAVRHSHVLQAEAALRNLLVAQLISVRMLGSEEVRKRQQRDFLEIYQAYQNLRSVSGWRRRRVLDTAWRNYKGNYEDAVPLFGEQSVKNSGTSTTVTGRGFTREEVMEKIDRFLKCLS
ncbi:hypothetical protein [Thiohalomonas denitrificans]|uniref:hypothetical protein n=1 Tax=Thiohalomonas denitrificans TaxID=415747 RepID=UPI0026F06AE6|nr:hypothetical protein [Thiohalomonas denitrificans]